MHPTILVQRRAVALNRITERAAALVKHLELDPVGHIAGVMHPELNHIRVAGTAQRNSLTRGDGFQGIFDHVADDPLQQAEIAGKRN